MGPPTAPRNKNGDERRKFHQVKFQTEKTSQQIHQVKLRKKARGKAGQLEGLPLIIKDNIDTSMLITTGGTGAFNDAADVPGVRHEI